MSFTVDQITTIILAMISSSVISIIVSALVNRSKLTAEVQRLHSEAATNTINNYRNLVADQKIHIDEMKSHVENMKARVAIADRSLALLPTLTRRIEELETELKREREQSAALRALAGNNHDLDLDSRAIAA
jgi:predicted RNase H-like nuclease (RuvC/YqgF family)